MWQELIVGLCVLTAIVFLIRRWLPLFTKKAAGCDTGCGGCGTSSTSCTSEKQQTSSDTNFF